MPAPTSTAWAPSPEAQNGCAADMRVWRPSVRRSGEVGRPIALGPAVVPLLLRELERRPKHWFAALRSLTVADPVAPADRGHLGRMAESWITWGKEHGYL